MKSSWWLRWRPVLPRKDRSYHHLLSLNDMMDAIDKVTPGWIRALQKETAFMAMFNNTNEKVDNNV